MKSISSVLFTMLALMSCSIFISCEEDLNYRKACDERDFVKAYQIVDKLKDEIHDAQTGGDGGGEWGREDRVKAARERAEEAERYVVLQEALMLLENGDDTSIMRIPFVAKEHQADSWLYAELIDVATRIGNDDLAKRLSDMIMK